MEKKLTFSFLAPVSLALGCVYAFCSYENPSGAAWLLFLGVSLWVYAESMKRLELPLKKGCGFYMAAILLLGISTCCTGDGRILFFNKLGILLLWMCMMLRQYYDTTGWGLGKYLNSILKTLTGAVGQIPAPFRDFVQYRKTLDHKPDRRVWAVLVGVLIGLPLVFVVLLILSSADALFRQYTKGLFSFLESSELFYNIAVILLKIGLLFFLTYGLYSFFSRRSLTEEVPDKRKGEPLLAITISSMLTLLYLVFSLVQIGGLFLGKMKLPDGYTYASYARQGFFQLLAVSLLNLVIVLVILTYFRESQLLKWILTVMSLCTFIMIASSAMRMIIYISYYYLTFLRILVLWALLVLALLFVGVLVSIYCRKFRLFRYSMAVVTVLYLALSFSHPDYLIAKVNLANTNTGHIGIAGGEAAPYNDFRLIRELSADAAPVVIPYLRERGYVRGTSANLVQGQRYFEAYLNILESDTSDVSIRTFNVSLYGAKKLLEDL
ncbi:MAG: DUF4153 domain-containing protein [Acetatifactor sp.]